MENRHYNYYSNEDIVKYAAEVKSCAGLLRKLNLKAVGGNYATMKRKLAELNVDCSHWSGQGWSKDKKLKNWENYKSTCNLKRHLIKYLGHKCEDCNLTIWKNEPIPIEVHHIDGDRTNNCMENLQLLCPNCHACTKNFRGRKIRTQQYHKIRQVVIPPIIETKKIVKEKPVKPPYVPKTKIDWPDKDKLTELVKTQSVRSLGKILGVSDNAIRRRLKKYGVDLRPISPWSQRHGS